MSRYTRIDSGTTVGGQPWEVGVIGEPDGSSRLVVMSGRTTISTRGDEQDRFAEAVARAVTPGQAVG